MTGVVRRGLARMREFAAVQEELTRRRQLLDRPWEEDLLHWHADGDDWSLHGSIPPPRDGRRRSTTPQGWCPGVPPRVGRQRDAM